MMGTSLACVDNETSSIYKYYEEYTVIFSQEGVQSDPRLLSLCSWLAVWLVFLNLKSILPYSCKQLPAPLEHKGFFQFCCKERSDMSNLKDALPKPDQPPTLFVLRPVFYLWPLSPSAGGFHLLCCFIYINKLKEGLQNYDEAREMGRNDNFFFYIFSSFPNRLVVVLTKHHLQHRSKTKEALFKSVSNSTFPYRC